MAEKIYSSFIPKKNPVETETKKRSTVGLFFVLALIVFVSAVVSWGGVALYKQSLLAEEKKLEDSLKKAQDSFEPGLLNIFEELDKKIKTAEVLLTQHDVLVPFFRSVEQLTLIGVQYNSVSYSREGGRHLVSMNGRAVDFPAIALQADELSEDKRILNPIFSNFNQNEDRSVSFDLGFTINPGAVKYVNLFEGTKFNR